MKLSQLSLADYNKLDSIPVINQDLSATDFTPVANTYYRHTGATTDTFTQGIIYLYDTAYHKLGESGGTTLNSYKVTFTNIQGNSALVRHLNRIAKNAKGRLQITDNYDDIYNISWSSDNWIHLYKYRQGTDSIRFETTELKSTDGSLFNPFWINIDANGVTYGRLESIADTLKVRYFNDTEIL